MISASLIAQLTLFQTSVSAAYPVSQASPLTKAALLKAGQQLIGSINFALAGAGTMLDSVDPTGFAGDMIGSLLAISTAANDQTALADMRGYVGRAVFNLAQA